MADGLLGFDPEQLKALMAQFGATEQDKKDANKQAAFALGFGLLQGRKGQELANFGQSGANAMLYRQQLLSNIPRQKMDALGGGVAAMGLAEKMRLMKDQQDFLSKFRPQQAASGPASIAPPGPPPMGDAGGFSAPGVTPPAPPPAAAGPSDPFKQLMAQADQLQAFADQTGNQTAAAKAAQMREQALKWREEYTAPVVGMQGNKPTFFRPGKYGGMQTVEGVAPPPDFMTVPLGGKTDIVNKYKLPGTGKSFEHTPTFSEQTGQKAQGLAERRFAWDKEQAAGANGPAAKTSFANENQLRDEFNKQAAPFITVRDAYRRVQSAAESAKTDKSGAADIALLFGYMKTLDPGSTVREGEFATAQNSGGVPGWVISHYNKALNGQLLSGEMRNNIVKSSDSLYRKAEEAHKNTEQQYTGLAKRNNLNPENVIVNYRVNGTTPKLVKNPDGSFTYVPAGG